MDELGDKLSAILNDPESMEPFGRGRGKRGGAEHIGVSRRDERRYKYKADNLAFFKNEKHGG